MMLYVTWMSNDVNKLQYIEYCDVYVNKTGSSSDDWIY
jgi:hypothetical protein